MSAMAMEARAVTLEPAFDGGVDCRTYHPRNQIDFNVLTHRIHFFRSAPRDQWSLTAGEWRPRW